jgi:hypothetical protein
VGRRRSCFSCGEQQAGTGAFCSACGKPLDAPDLELIAADTVSESGTDVVLTSGSSRTRSMLAIGVVLAALVGVAAFSGAGKTSTTAPTSTTSTTTAADTTTAPSTSTTTATETTQKRSTDPRPVTPTPPTSLTIAGGSDTTVAPTPGAPVPLLPGETTGAKLLLVGRFATGPTDTIIDVDTGAVTPLESSTFPDRTSVRLLTTATGVVLNGSGGFNVQLFTADGAVKQYRRAGLGSEGAGVVIGDVLWTTQIEADGRTRRLASIDLQTGTAEAWVDMPFGTFLVGQDESGRPMVQAGVVSATYAFDTATKQFDRVSATAILDSNGQQRVEVLCDERLACRFVLRGPRDGIRDGTVTELADFAENSTALVSPSGENVLIITYAPLGASFDVVNVETGERTALLNRSFANGDVPWSWSVDGKWLFFLNDNKLWAWRFGLSEPVEILVDGKSVQASALGVFPNPA